MSDTKPDAIARVAPRQFSLMPSSLGEAKEMATMIANSDFAPKDYRGKPENVLIAVQMGADLGLKPMQALQNIAVINGRPSIYGDAALALVMPALERFVESFEGKEGEDSFAAVCIARRKGWPDETRRTFSIADAKKANLWGKAGPWTTYPKRMMQFRARGFTLRDVAPDLMLGLVIAEEAGDYPDAINAEVVASEVVQEPIERVPESFRDNLLKAGEALNFSKAQLLAKINEFFGKDGVTPEDAAQGLLEWCRDEYARRKTGRPRKVDNGKQTAPPSTPPSSAPVPPPSTVGGTAPQPSTAPVAATEINFQSGPPPVQPLGELF